MLILGSRFENEAVMSFQTASEVARTTRPIIDPRNFRIMAYELTGPLLKNRLCAILIEDIREIGEIGMIIDHAEEISDIQDILKLNEVYDFGFVIKDILVVDEKGKKIGKVSDYTIDTDTFQIQQLSVRRPFLKSFGDTELLIHRSQITAVDNQKVTIHSSQEKPKEPVRQVFRPNYDNPFRSSTSPAPDTIDRAN